MKCFAITKRGYGSVVINNTLVLLDYIKSNDFVSINETLVTYLNNNITSSITATSFTALLAKYMPAKSPLQCIYWERRGFNATAAKLKIAELQSINSKKSHDKHPSNSQLANTISYWIKKGYSEAEAKIFVSIEQKKRSPRCVEYWINKGYDTEQAKESVSTYQKGCTNNDKFKASMKRTDRSPTQLAYWLVRGYSEIQAEEILKDRQSTFSLKKCIEKYGEEIGHNIFKERQYKWINTMNSKSPEEIKLINFKRGRDKNGVPHVGARYTEENIKGHFGETTIGKLYYLHFHSTTTEFWKVGITIKEINERFNPDRIYRTSGFTYDILISKTMSIADCFKHEQAILKRFNKHRISVNTNGFKSTECFNKNIFNLIKEEL